MSSERKHCNFSVHEHDGLWTVVYDGSPILRGFHEHGSIGKSVAFVADQS
jgi:hypothetical protein